MLITDHHRTQQRMEERIVTSLPNRIGRIVSNKGIRGGLSKWNHPWDIQPYKNNMIDVPWFHTIFNAFSLILVCVQKPFCIDFCVSFSLFSRNLSNDEHRCF